jgi:CheY-like chemotaxis protein
MARILVVDDEASVRNSLRKLLERGGFDVMEASSGEAALAAIVTDTAIDALVSDFLMPGINGLDFYDRLVAKCLTCGGGSCS